MKIAIAQINTRPGDFEATSERIIDLSLNAAAQDVDLLLLPLATYTGQCLPDYASCEGFFMDLGAELEDLPGAVACSCLIPIATSGGEGGYDAVLMQDGVAMPVGFVSWLLEDAKQDDGEQTAGRGTFEFAGRKLAIAYTYDDIQALEEANADIDVLLYFPERGFALDDPSSALGASLAEGRFRDDAWTLDAWIVGIGSLGGYDLQVYPGSSFVINPRGELVACAPAFEEALLVASVEDEVESDDLPHSAITGFEAASGLEPELYDRSMHLWEVLSLGLRDMLEKQGYTEVALVLDGRLNSSVLATLASDALGPTHVHALVDPLQDAGYKLKARQLASALHVDLCEVAGIPLGDDADERLRQDVVQSHLAFLARRCEAVPLSSIDKTFFALEAQVGACSSAVLAPLGDVYRTDLIELAHLRNTISPVIDAGSIRSYDVPRIAGLDEVEPTPEARLRRVDVTLAAYIEWERSLTDVVARQGCEEVCVGIADALAACELGRLALPSCIAVSSRTVREMRIPLGMAWRDRVRPDAERLPDGDLLGTMASSFGVNLGGALPGDADDNPMASSIAAMLERMQAELLGSEPAAGGPDAPDRQVGELLGLLRDILQDGGLSAGGGSGDMPFGPLTWGSPFSEN